MLRPTDFQKTLREAVVWSWLAVATVTRAFFLILSAIVFRGSRKIDAQSRALEERVTQVSKLLAPEPLLAAARSASIGTCHWPS